MPNGNERTLWRVIGFVLGVVAVLVLARTPGLRDRLGDGPDVPEATIGSASDALGAGETSAMVNAAPVSGAGESSGDTGDSDTGASSVAETAESATRRLGSPAQGAEETADARDATVVPEAAAQTADTPRVEDAAVALPESASVSGQTSGAASESMSDVAPERVDESAALQEGLEAAGESEREVVAGAGGVRWSSVWRPFASARTAEGFAQYIGEATGLDLRVGPTDGSGTYVVEVSHRSDPELDAAVERIAQATGFRAPERLR